MRGGFQISLVIRDFPVLSDSNIGNTGTPVVTRSRLVRALRSFILLYMRVIIEMNILMLRGVFGMIVFTGVFSLTATAVTLLKPAVIAVTRPGHHPARQTFPRSRPGRSHNRT
jgi:hypothetical protein